MNTNWPAFEQKWTSLLSCYYEKHASREIQIQCIRISYFVCNLSYWTCVIKMVHAAVVIYMLITHFQSFSCDATSKIKLLSSGTFFKARQTNKVALLALINSWYYFSQGSSLYPQHTKYVGYTVFRLSVCPSVTFSFTLSILGNLLMDLD